MNPVCYGLMLIPVVMSKLPEYFKLFCMNPVCYGLMLIPVVMSKLPEYFKLTTTQKFGQDLWDIKLILESFKNKLAVLEI